MSSFKNYTQSGRFSLLAIVIGSIAIAPISSVSLTIAQMLPLSTNIATVSSQIIIPARTTIPVRHDEAEKILITKQEKMLLILRVAVDIKNRNGKILIPYGSEIVGQIEPAGNGSRFVAKKLVIKESKQQYIEQPLDATSQIVNKTEIVDEGSNTENIVKGATMGAVAASIVAEIRSEKATNSSRLGVLAGWILGSRSTELISINPNTDLDITLNSDLNIR